MKKLILYFYLMTLMIMLINPKLWAKCPLTPDDPGGTNNPIILGPQSCPQNQIWTQDCYMDGCYYQCEGNCLIPDPECPNGHLEEGEECDDGNNSNQDACLNHCQPASCGDGYVWLGHEECDDGNQNNTDSCSNDCQIIEPIECGNGVIQGSEQCDDGNNSNQDSCLNNCNLNQCGDGFVLAGQEECDDGNQNNEDNCTNNCQLVVAPECGNGIIEGDEACDDGDDNNTDFCLINCQLAGCGDGYVWEGHEQCDDGNQNNNDSCNNDCQIIEPPECGNGIIEGNETCDDGNSINSDNCLNNCQFADS